MREALGLSQAQIAERLGRGLRTVNRWEREPKSVDMVALELLERIAREEGKS